MPKKLPGPCKMWASMIQREVGYFNGWIVSADEERKSCEKAALKIYGTLRRRAIKLPPKDLKDYIMKGIK